jgi:hypothetical protein
MVGLNVPFPVRCGFFGGSVEVRQLSLSLQHVRVFARSVPVFSECFFNRVRGVGEERRHAGFHFIFIIIVIYYLFSYYYFFGPTVDALFGAKARRRLNFGVLFIRFAQPCTRVKKRRFLWILAAIKCFLNIGKMSRTDDGDRASERRWCRIAAILGSLVLIIAAL